MRRRLLYIGLALTLAAAIGAAVPQVRSRVRAHLDPYTLLRTLGLRAVNSGSGRPMSVEFDHASDHYARLEADRARQRAAVERGDVDRQSPTSMPASPATATLEPAPTPQSEPTPPVARDLPGEPAEMVAGETAPAALPSAGRYWTSFRGPRRDGRYTEAPVALDWAALPPREAWRQPVGGGYASFTVADGRVFTIEQRRGEEVVAAYALDNGQELWTHGWAGAFSESMGGDGPRATPTWHDGYIYALGAEGELRCLRAESGTLVWRHQILTENGADNLQWGMAASPLVVDDKVVVLPGGSNGRSVVAYHRLTGATVWSVLDEAQAYTAPMLATINGQRQLLVVSAKRVMGLDVADGRVLWEFPWVTDFGVNTAQPIIIGTNRVFVSAGYGHGAAVFAVIDASGRQRTEQVWQNTRMKNKFTSSVLHDGFIYGLDEAILACIDAATGELKWKGGRYGYGQLVLVDDRLIITTEDGALVQVRATPNGHQELARLDVLEGKTWNHPALASGRLLVRNQTEMACYDVRPTPATTAPHTLSPR